VPALAFAGVPVMPLKGILLACCAPDLLRRPLADADLLVPRASFERALAILVRLGGRSLPSTSVRKRAVVFGHPGQEWNVDLHAELWPAAFIPLDLEAAWHDATLQDSPFSAPVHVPPRRFAFAHAAGHFARSGHSAASDYARALEIGALLDWTLETESAPDLAAYLVSSGATPAVRYALAASVAASPRPSVTRMESLLPLGAAHAALLRRVSRGSWLHPRLLRPLVSS
jgi:hypothetical protein